MIKLRIGPAGTIHGLWSDTVDWNSLGRVSVTRASHVEFSDQRQQWYVRAARPRNRLRRILQLVLRRPFGEIVHWAKTRQEALAWERAYYEPGGPGCTADETRRKAIPTAEPGRTVSREELQ